MNPIDHLLNISLDLTYQAMSREEYKELHEPAWDAEDRMEEEEEE